MDDVGTGEKGNTENPGTNTTLLTAPDVVADPANPADPGTVVNPVDPASADPAGPGAQPKGMKILRELSLMNSHGTMKSDLVESLNLKQLKVLQKSMV